MTKETAAAVVEYVREAFPKCEWSDVEWAICTRKLLPIDTTEAQARLAVGEYRFQHKYRTPDMGALVEAIYKTDTAHMRYRTTNTRKSEEQWSPPTEGHYPGEWCDMLAAGQDIPGVPPRGKAWMLGIAASRAKQREEGRTVFEPTGWDLAVAIMAGGPLSKKGKRTAPAAGGGA